MHGTKIRVLIADNDQVTLDGLIAVLTPQADIQVIGHTRSLTAARELVAEMRPDVVILDNHFGTGLEDGIQAFEQVRGRFPTTKGILISVEANTGHVKRAVRAGFDAYLMKADAHRLPETVRLVHAGSSEFGSVASVLLELQRTPHAKLTPAEERVLEVVVEGLTYEEIAAELGVKGTTVRAHICELFAKTGCTNKAQLLLWGLRAGYRRPTARLPRGPR